AAAREELSTELPLWFSNLAFWSLQVAVLVLAAGILARALRIQQPRVLLASWRSLLAVSLLLPLLQPWHHPQAAPAIAISADFAGLPPSSESAAILHAVRILVSAPAEFRLSSQVDSPVTFGFWAPLILLPEHFPSLEPRFQSAIACHELLHVRRRDWAHHLGEEAFRALF